MCSSSITIQRRSVARRCDLATLVECFDHIPIVCKLSIKADGAKNAQFVRRRVPYHRSKIGMPRHDKVFLDALYSAPQISYSFDTTSHCHMVQEYLRCAAEEAYSRDGPIKKDKEITDQTFQKIISHGKALRTCLLYTSDSA